MEFVEDSSKVYVSVKDVLERHRELTSECIDGPGTSYHCEEQAWWDLKRELKKKIEVKA